MIFFIINMKVMFCIVILILIIYISKIYMLLFNLRNILGIMVYGIFYFKLMILIWFEKNYIVSIFICRNILLG